VKVAQGFSRGIKAGGNAAQQEVHGEWGLIRTGSLSAGSGEIEVSPAETRLRRVREVSNQRWRGSAETRGKDSSVMLAGTKGRGNTGERKGSYGAFSVPSVTLRG